MTNQSISELIIQARKEQGISLRDFSKALRVSHTQIQNYESGQQLPDSERVAGWVCSDTDWVRRLGAEIFIAEYGELVKAVLSPNSSKSL